MFKDFQQLLLLTQLLLR